MNPVLKDKIKQTIIVILVMSGLILAHWYLYKLFWSVVW